jgi:hypothetical protein
MDHARSLPADSRVKRVTPMLETRKAYLELFVDRRERILDEWARAAESHTPPLPTDERARRSMRSVLAEMVLALEGGDGEGRANVEQGGTPRDVAAQARSYGVLHRVVTTEARVGGIELTPAEQATVTSTIHEAIARSIDTHLEGEERRLHRVAHQLRNALGSATMALTLLRARIDLGDNARLGEMLERNLLKLQGHIDTVVHAGVDSAHSGQAETEAVSQEAVVHPRGRE